MGKGLESLACVCGIVAWAEIFARHFVAVINAFGSGLDYDPSLARHCTPLLSDYLEFAAPLFDTH